ncbi:FAD-dependent oxidoreductase [Nocardia seriolae]|nr:FAD-binding oxidoreductase [Nocardia seriolae]
MSERAEVLVIGGGVIGTSIACQLAEAGVGVVLLDRGALGSGSSGTTAGVVRTYFPGSPLSARRRSRCSVWNWRRLRSRPSPTSAMAARRCAGSTTPRTCAEYGRAPVLAENRGPSVRCSTRCPRSNAPGPQCCSRGVRLRRS